MGAIHDATSEIVYQRNGKILVTPGPQRPHVAASVRLCAQLEAIVAGSYLFELSPVTIWGSAARRIAAETILERLDAHSSTPIPAPVAGRILELHARYGALWLERDAAGNAQLGSRDPSIPLRLGLDASAKLAEKDIAPLRRAVADAGWPVLDRRGGDEARSFCIAMRPTSDLRPYQSEAVEAHISAGDGVVLLPCGAGKTMVGIGVMNSVSAPTLILTPSRDIAHQWREAVLTHTTVNLRDIAVSSAQAIKPITITTYQAASRGRIAPALQSEAWGLIIFDEVQSLPADVFRTVSGLASGRRLGLSATLVREDGREAEVFAMVGPVVYDLPWIELEHAGWIAPARCYEIRIPEAASATERERYKRAVVERILAMSEGRPTLLVGTSVKPLTAAAERFGLPLLTGQDDQQRRSVVLDSFRSGAINRLAISRIGSVGLDLPNTQVMIQLNGNFGSRQEEAQRLGRLLRPGNGETVHFYSLASEGTREIEYARRRQRFLVDQGYEYQILSAADLPRA